MCFCMAWEQLLKAIIIENQGDDSAIYKNLNKNGIKETIALQKSTNLNLSDGDEVRANLEKVVFLRKQATQLLMPEIQGITSRFFQSGICNYSSNACRLFGCSGTLEMRQKNSA